MRNKPLARVLLLFVVTLVMVIGGTGGAQQPGPEAIPDWYNVAEFQQDAELLKDFIALELKAEEWPQFAQLWQQFRLVTALQDQTMRAQLEKIRQQLAKAETQETYDQVAGQAEALKSQLEPPYKQALESTVQGVKNLLGPERCKQLEVKNTLFDWAAGVIESSRKIRKESPTYWETLREDIIGSLSENSSAGHEVFPVSEVRFWLNDVSTLSDTQVEQRKWELYIQFANWLWPKSMVDMALSELEKKDHLGEYLTSILTNPMMPYALQAKLAAVAPAP